MLHIKSNVSILGAAIGYRVDESGFSWTGESRLTAADLLAAESVGEERAADEEARTFLRDLLADGPLAARKVFEKTRKAGINEITLRRAKARAHPRSYNADRPRGESKKPSAGTRQRRRRKLSR